jgi:hypothetical protein
MPTVSETLFVSAPGWVLAIDQTSFRTVGTVVIPMMKTTSHPVRDDFVGTKDRSIPIIYCSPVKGRGRGAMWAIAGVLWRPNQVYLAVVDSSFRWGSHQGDGGSCALHPVQRLCHRRTSWWTSVQRAGLLLDSAEGPFTSESTGASYSSR